MGGTNPPPMRKSEWTTLYKGITSWNQRHFAEVAQFGTNFSKTYKYPANSPQITPQATLQQ